MPILVRLFAVELCQYEIRGMLGLFFVNELLGTYRYPIRVCSRILHDGLTPESAVSFGPRDRWEEKAICRRKRQNTIARQQSTTNMPLGIITRRRTTTKLATTR